MHHQIQSQRVQQQVFDLQAAEFHSDGQCDDAAQREHSTRRHCTTPVVLHRQATNQDRLSRPIAMHEYREDHLDLL